MEDHPRTDTYLITIVDRYTVSPLNAFQISLITWLKAMGVIPTILTLPGMILQVPPHGAHFLLIVGGRWT